MEVEWPPQLSIDPAVPGSDLLTITQLIYSATSDQLKFFIEIESMEKTLDENAKPSKLLSGSFSASDEPLTVNLGSVTSAPFKNTLHSPILRLKPGTEVRFLDRSSDSAFSSQYDSSPRSSTGSSNPSEGTPLTVQVPIIIGDRVYVGPSRLSGTIAYMGPTHFAAGDMVAKHSPNCRIRTEPFTTFLGSHTNGLDYRRVSLCNSNQFGRSSSARFTRRNPPFSSVIGEISPRTRSSPFDLDVRNLKRSKSDRFNFSRPQWKPPGSPTASTYSQSAHEKLFAKSLSHRSQTLPRPARKSNLLVSFDLNASHDLEETTSVVSCPSLRSTIRNSSKTGKANSSISLPITDSRRLFKTLKGSWSGRFDRITRSRTWSPDRSSTTRVRSRSAGSNSRQQPITLSSETSKLTARHPQLYSSYPETESPNHSSGSTNSLLHSYLPKCLSADIVIECAQDRLVELQNQVVEAYRARAEVTQALDEQRRRYKELLDVYEQYRCGTLGPPKSRPLPSTSQLDEMHKQLSNEYERTKNLLFQLKCLSLQLDEQHVTKSRTTDESRKQTHPRHCSSTSSKIAAKNSLDAIEEQESETPPESVPPSSPASVLSTQIEVTVTSPDHVDCQIERLRVNSAHQRQCDKLLCKMVVCRETLRDKLKELQEQRSQIGHTQPESNEDQGDSTECEADNIVYYCDILYTLRVSIPCIPESSFQTQRWLFLRNRARTESDSAVNLVAELQECNNSLRRNVETMKLQMDNETDDQISVLRNTLRIHQLKQMEYKAKVLYHEQTKLMRSKHQELANVVNEFNLVSQMWASERDLKLYANQQLSDRLAMLTGNPVVSQQKNTRSKAQPGWEKRQDLNGSGSSVTKPDESPMIFSLFSALCKEIRRLQTRSADLIDALNNLNSGGCSATQLVHIRTLVHQSEQPSCNSKTIKIPVRHSTRRQKSKGCHMKNGFGSFHPHTPSSCFDLSLSSKNLESVQTPNDTGSFASSTTDHPSSISHAGLKARRRRPVSFYLKRSFEPVLEDTIHEADEEQAESP
ncbi:hypothetical protein FGIG_04124 [Fasciola gigantica]|uniref:Uncharacterized protein n=1 Tax=Fasciola gigantica TaxID=46835 RepID=A0A504YSB1_FASGI|nr:hypothetical protein FGIG_04124 [Fasciola gigantica]